MLVNEGEVYVLKGQDPPNYAVIVESAQEDNVVIWDTGCYDSERDFHSIPHGKETHFLERYKLATPEQRAGLIAELKGKQRVIAQKLNLLEKVAQSQPSCIDDEPFDFMLWE